LVGLAVLFLESCEVCVRKEEVVLQADHCVDQGRLGSQGLDVDFGEFVPVFADIEVSVGDDLIGGIQD
jgi:hypothetical protein